MIVAFLNNRRLDSSAQILKLDAGEKCIIRSQPTQLIGKDEDSLNALFMGIASCMLPSTIGPPGPAPNVQTSD